LGFIIKNAKATTEYAPWMMFASNYCRIKMAHTDSVDLVRYLTESNYDRIKTLQTIIDGHTTDYFASDYDRIETVHLLA